jgi:hypothetical protein
MPGESFGTPAYTGVCSTGWSVRLGRWLATAVIWAARWLARQLTAGQPPLTKRQKKRLARIVFVVLVWGSPAWIWVGAGLVAHAAGVTVGADVGTVALAAMILRVVLYALLVGGLLRLW